MRVSKREDRAAQIRAWRRMVADVTSDVTSGRAGRGGRQSDNEAAIAALVRHADYASYKAAWDRYETTGLRGLVKRLRRVKPIGGWLNKIFPENRTGARMVIGDNRAPAVLLYMSQKISKLEKSWGIKP